jgi:hypothetical protein
LGYRTGDPGKRARAVRLPDVVGVIKRHGNKPLIAT